MDDFDSGPHQKTLDVLAFAGERIQNIESGRVAKDVIATIEAAIRKEYGDKAQEIAFHLSDWNAEAAFLVALHLFPEKFTPEEILEGINDLLIHAPNHLAAAAALADCPGDDIFNVGVKVTPDLDEDGSDPSSRDC